MGRLLLSLLALPLLAAGCGDEPTEGAPQAAGAGGSGQGGAGASAGGAGGPGAGAAGASGGAGGAGQGGKAGPDPCEKWSAPPGGGIDDTLPDLPVRRLIDGAEEATTLHALRASCEQPALLALRVEPAWCEPCMMRDDLLAELLSPFPQVRVETLLYAGPDNARTTAADLAAHQQAHPTLPGGRMRPEADAGEALVRGHGALPLVYLVDLRTLRISNVLEAPFDSFLVEQVAASLTEVGGPTIKPPAAGAPPLVDDRFDAFDWSLVQRMVAPFAPPPNPSNARADDPAAAALGKKLFDDKLLAGEAGVACATCHDPAKGHADGLPTAKGVEVGKINTPTALAGMNRWFFWDGRADTLWSQALGPLENPGETGGSRLHVAHRVHGAYKAEYEAIFGALPPLDDDKRFPAQGKPGDAAYEAMAADDRELVTRVFVNVGKAIEAHERTLRPPPSRLDDYAKGDFDKLTPIERDGLKAFIHSGCVNCHHGPALSDGAFHNILMPGSAPPGDRGRIDGLASLLSSPFRKDGPYSDAPEAHKYPADLAPGDEMLGQVKTPSLRNAAATGPWGHGGTFATLLDVTKHYGQVVVTGKGGPASVGASDPSLGGFLAGHNAELLAFLALLGGE